MNASSTFRSIISAIFGILFLLFSFWLSMKIAGIKKVQEKTHEKVVKTVFVDTVQNTTQHINLSATGNLQAVRKVELFAEVQGIFSKSSHLFKPGQQYNSGSLLMQINNDEYTASLLAARSSLYNQLMSIIPDLRLDYPNVAAKWEAYANQFNVNKTTTPLPAFETDQEKFFINGRGVVNAFYNVKNMEERLDKYSIYAPFNGVLTEAIVQEGALVRAGQKLGVFSDLSKFELALNINGNYKNILQVGNNVTLHSIEGNATYNGVVKRINNVLDPSTQSITAFVEVQGQGLSEGMFLNADLKGKAEENVYEISRKLLINNQSVFAVKDSTLVLINVNPVYFGSETALVKGLPNGTLVLEKSVPGAYNGMMVIIQK